RRTGGGDPYAVRHLSRARSPHRDRRPDRRPDARSERSMTTPLAEVLDGQHAAEVRKAARALLKQPLLLSHGRHAEEFRLVRRHASELREWFDRNTGWPLHVDAETARLRKIPGVLDDATHPAREATRAPAPFTRRRYVLL